MSYFVLQIYLQCHSNSGDDVLVDFLTIDIEAGLPRACVPTQTLTYTLPQIVSSLIGITEYPSI